MGGRAGFFSLDLYQVSPASPDFSPSGSRILGVRPWAKWAVLLGLVRTYQTGTWT